MSSSFFPTGEEISNAFTISAERLMKRQRSKSNSSASSSSPSLSNTPRPRRITMPGMIYDANRILEKAMDPDSDGLHPGLFDPDLLGIGFYTVWEAGIIFSGNIGTGIVLARNPMDPESWSPPAAVGLRSIGAGLMAGASMKHLVYLIYDYYTLECMSGENGVVVSSQVEATLFKFGRQAEMSAIMSAKGVGSNIALSCDNRGFFGGISIEGGIMKGRKHVNENFYAKKGIKTADILFSGDTYDVPSGTMLPELYVKLKKLCGGDSVYEPTPEELQKIESTRERVEREEAKAAQQLPFMMVVEGEESMESPGAALEALGDCGEEEATIVPSIIHDDHDIAPKMSDASIGFNSVSVLSDSDLPTLAEGNDENKHKTTDCAEMEKRFEAQAEPYIESGR